MFTLSSHGVATPRNFDRKRERGRGEDFSVIDWGCLARLRRPNRAQLAKVRAASERSFARSLGAKCLEGFQLWFDQRVSARRWLRSPRCSRARSPAKIIRKQQSSLKKKKNTHHFVALAQASPHPSLFEYMGFKEPVFRSAAFLFFPASLGFNFFRSIFFKAHFPHYI